MKTLFLVLAASLLATACAGAPQPGPMPAAISVEGTAPRGAVEWPFTFTWKGYVPSGAVCRVSVFDVAERQLLQRDTKEATLSAPEDLRLLLASTRRFLWRVSVLDQNGNEAAQSALVEFSVR